MNTIKCPHCGEESPAFDYAHVCMKGPYAAKLQEPEYTDEEEEAWLELEQTLKEIKDMTKDALKTYINKLKK